MHLATHTHEGKLILVIYDSDLNGKFLEDKNRQLDLTSAFYKGAEAKEDEATTLLRKASVIHAAGKKTISFLERCGFPVQSVSSVIKNVPFVLIVQE